jgi:hypothetical protein
MSNILQGIVLSKPTSLGQREEKPLFKKELPQWKIQIEFQRRVALECSKKCMMHKSSENVIKNSLKALEDNVPDYSGISLTPAEQVCLNRCISKIMNVKEVVDGKLA